MAKESNNTKEEGLSKIDSRIEAVRDLIFGENIQAYNAEFSAVYDKIQALKEESERNLEKAIAQIESNLADLERLLDHKVQDLTADLNKGLDELDDAKVDRRKLGQALEKIALMLQE
jgi:tRNA U34 5-carboxymethylaminomethyl modifying GTPase MnmE/TrmE